MKEIYVSNPEARVPAKNIYNDFKEWVIGKHGISIWNKIQQRQIYTALKNLSEYAYIRYKEGYCLKGISYKPKRIEESKISYITLSICQPSINQQPEVKHHQMAPRMPQIKMPQIKIPQIKKSNT